MLKVYPYGAIAMGMTATGAFKVNNFRLKQDIAGERSKGRVTCALLDASLA